MNIKFLVRWVFGGPAIIAFGFSDLKKITNSRPSASNFKSFSPSIEQFFLTVSQDNFGNNIPKIKIWFELLQYCVNFIFLGYNTNARTSWSKSGPVCETI